jgi:hypothetical protein
MLWTLFCGGGTGQYYENGNAAGGSFAASASTSASDITVGSIGGLGGFDSDPYFQELIVYPSDQKTNRVGMETDRKTFYNITY